MFENFKSYSKEKEKLLNVKMIFSIFFLIPCNLKIKIVLEFFLF